MAAAVCHQEGHRPARGSTGTAQGLARERRVVVAADAKCLNLDTRQVCDRAGSRVVVFSTCETMKGRSHEFVEFVEATCGQYSRWIQRARLGGKTGDQVQYLRF